MKKEKKKKTSKKSEDQEMERLMLLRKSDQVKGEQLTIDSEGKFKSEKEVKDYAIGTVDNPEKKYELYYQGIQKLMRENLPQGSFYKNARKLVYEEKNIFINRGNKKGENGVRGSDGRMAYAKDLQAALNTVATWVFNNGTAVDLYSRFYELNKKNGYRTENKKIEKVFTSH